MRICNWIFLVPLIFLGCVGQLNPAELIKYVKNEKNGLAKTKTVGGVSMHVQYKPVAYVIASEMRSNDIASEDFSKREEALAHAQYYDLKLSLETGGDIMTYLIKDDAAMQERIYYLSFLMQEHIMLVDGQDTLKPQLYHFEKSLDMANEKSFVLAFERKPENEHCDKTFIWDSPVFGAGPIKIKFKREDINKVPSIKLLP